MCGKMNSDHDEHADEERRLAHRADIEPARHRHAGQHHNVAAGRRAAVVAILVVAVREPGRCLHHHFSWKR